MGGSNDMNLKLVRKFSALASMGLFAALLCAVPSAAQTTKDQQNCINTLNKGYAKVAKTQDKEIDSCLKAGLAGKLLEPTVDDCSTADAKLKLDKAKTKTVDGENKKCFAPLPLFARSGAAIVNDAAVRRSLGLAADLFGDDLHTTVIGASADTAACQTALAKQAMKCAQTRVKTFNKCKKDALAGKDGPAVTTRDQLRARCHDETAGGVPDPGGKIAKICATKLSTVVEKRCAAITQATAFPGACALAGDLGQCVDERVRCAVCLGLDRADSLQSDCDIADNGLADGGCRPECGDGIVEFPEQCDDGGVTPGDGCDATCNAELPFAISIVNQNILQNITPGNVGYDDLVDRLTLFADQLAVSQPDLIPLQEAVLGFSGTAAILAADLSARYSLEYFAVEYGLISGNALLSRWPAVVEEQELLPSFDDVASFPDRRFAARIRVESPLGPLDVYPMHLCSACDSAERVVQTQAFADFVAKTHTSAHPAIVGADFNAHTGTAGDSNPVNDPPIDLLVGAGWYALFDGGDAICDAPTDRSGCTSGIHDLTEIDDTSTRRIDNVMIAPAATIGPIPPASQAVELGPTTRYGAAPGTDPNPECHFNPRLPCNDDGDCPANTHCNRNDFCVRDSAAACTTNTDCPGDIAPDFCRTTLWISDHLGVSTGIELQALP